MTQKVIDNNSDKQNNDLNQSQSVAEDNGLANIQVVNVAKDIIYKHKFAFKALAKWLT